MSSFDRAQQYLNLVCLQAAMSLRITLTYIPTVHTSVPKSFMRAKANSLKFPCSTPEVTRGIGMSLKVQIKAICITECVLHRQIKQAVDK